MTIPGIKRIFYVISLRNLFSLLIIEKLVEKMRAAKDIFFLNYGGSLSLGKFY